LADWQRALDDLQSVGQSSQYLADLEVTSSQLDLLTSSFSRVQNNFTNDPPMTSQHYERRPYLQLPTSSTRSRSLRRSGSNPSSSSKTSICTLLPLKFHKIIITKDHLGEDFGFSLADGESEPGVYVHTIRSSSPASRAGLLAYDRILQVNGRAVSDADSRLVVYLVSSNTQPRLILFISRYGSGGNSYITKSSSGSPHQRQKILLAAPISPASISASQLSKSGIL